MYGGLLVVTWLTGTMIIKAALIAWIIAVCVIFPYVIFRRFKDI